MVLRHLFQMSQVVAAAFLLSCAATTQTSVANRQYGVGTGPSDKLQLPSSFRHSVGAQHFQGYRLAQGKDADGGPGL